MCMRLLLQFLPVHCISAPFFFTAAHEVKPTSQRINKCLMASSITHGVCVVTKGSAEAKRPRCGHMDVSAAHIAQCQHVFDITCSWSYPDNKRWIWVFDFFSKSSRTLHIRPQSDGLRTVETLAWHNLNIFSIFSLKIEESQRDRDPTSGDLHGQI